MNGEFYFDMNKQAHRLYGKSMYMLKRWQKYDIFTKTGAYVRSENPNANTYVSTSVYLYDYIVVSDSWFLNNVVTASYTSTVPSVDSDYAGSGGNEKWTHHPNTWKNSPNATVNNYILQYNPNMSLPTWQGGVGHSYYGPNVLYRDDGTYFEIVRGYPRNHYTHKRGYFALDRFVSYGIDNGGTTTQTYQKGRQTSDTTIGPNGLDDGSSPVQSTTVSNVDIVKSDNVIYH